MEIPKEKSKEVVTAILTSCELFNTSSSMYQRAFELVENYDFQIFDAIIVSSAIEVNCEILYTEDMHHGLIVEKQLTIVNPFVG